MNDVIGVIQSIEDDSYQGKDFKKVTLKDGSVLKVKYGREGLLKAKWGELQVERAFKFIMGDYQGKPFVQDFVAVEGELPESVQTTVAPGAIPKHKPSGEERGMWLKELGSMLRCGDIDKTTPHGKLLRHFYYAAMFNVLDIEIKEEEVK